MNKLLKALSSFTSENQKVGPSYQDYSGDRYQELSRYGSERTQASKPAYEQQYGFSKGMMEGQPAPEPVEEMQQVAVAAQVPGQDTAPQLFGGVEVNPNVQGGMPRPPLPPRNTLPQPSLEMVNGPRMRSVSDEIIADLTAKIGIDLNKSMQSDFYGGVATEPTFSTYPTTMSRQNNIPQMSLEMPNGPDMGATYGNGLLKENFTAPQELFEEVPEGTDTDILITPEGSGYVDDVFPTEEQEQFLNSGGSMDMPYQGQEVPQVQPFLDSVIELNGPQVVDVISAEEKALLETISFAEGTKTGYGTLFGGEVLPDLEKGNYTVGQVIEMSKSKLLPDGKTKAGYGKYKGKESGATGKYQMMGQVLLEEAKTQGIDLNEKFTPQLQDKIMLGRIKRFRGVNADDLKKQGLTVKMVDSLAKEFASFPYSPKGGKSYYGQPYKTLQQVMNKYKGLLDPNMKGGFQGTGEF